MILFIFYNIKISALVGSFYKIIIFMIIKNNELVYDYEDIIALQCFLLFNINQINIKILKIKFD